MNEHAWDGVSRNGVQATSQRSMKTCPTCGGITEAVWGEGMGGIPCTCNDKPIYEQHIEDTVNFGGSKIIILQLQQENQILRDELCKSRDCYNKVWEEKTRLREALKKLSNSCETLNDVEFHNLTKVDEQILAGVEHHTILARAALAPQEGKTSSIQPITDL